MAMFQSNCFGLCCDVPGTNSARTKVHVEYWQRTSKAKSDQTHQSPVTANRCLDGHVSYVRVTPWAQIRCEN